jgi:hypothetical protein
MGARIERGREPRSLKAYNSLVKSNEGSLRFNNHLTLEMNSVQRQKQML